MVIKPSGCSIHGRRGAASSNVPSRWSCAHLSSSHLHKCSLPREVTEENSRPFRRHAARKCAADTIQRNRIPNLEVRYYKWLVIAVSFLGGMDQVNTQIEQALEILQSGNRQDAERALETLQGVVYGFGMKVCGSHEDAQDTAQETLIRLARQLREFPDARALSVWLYKVAKTQCLMSRRKSKFAPAQMLSLDDLMPKDSDLSPAGTKSWQITPEEICPQCRNCAAGWKTPSWRSPSITAWS